LTFDSALDRDNSTTPQGSIERARGVPSGASGKARKMRNAGGAMKSRQAAELKAGLRGPGGDWSFDSQLPARRQAPEAGAGTNAKGRAVNAPPAKSSSQANFVRPAANSVVQ